MNIIILGPPGSGKGTQAEIISNQLGIPHISTGDILRNEIEKATEIGQKVASIMKGGNLVDDETIISITIKALKSDKCAKGFILDGMPRSLAQAEALKANNIHIDNIIELVCEDDKIVERIASRRVHPGSGRVYNLIYNPPEKEDKDDLTGEDLVQREDDKEEVVRNRLQNYAKTTSPLLQFYKDMAERDSNISYNKLSSVQEASVLAQEIIELLKS